MLTRSLILTALTHLSDELGKMGILGELNVVGGNAMILAFNARESTKDVDAIFEPTFAFRTAAGQVARDLALPSDWLNDAAKGYLSPMGTFSIIDVIELPNLRVQAPTPEYMLAMKVLAARVGVAGVRGDTADIAFLIRLLGLTETAAVMDIVSRYYDPWRILPRSSYLVDEILEQMRT